ncbi:MAG: nucleoside 2-deoxyribosyltransferase [Gammaproteobacteria bacterium]
MDTTLHIYFAGDIFDHKDLAGNALLAQHIEATSDGRYACVLPQNLEQSSNRAVNIRNQDLYQVMRCDLALFNFDGDDLDSGTVVEFMLAKMLDIPALILRSDFRSAGDQNKDGDDWNLMCSFYPRSRKIQFNAMAWFQAGHRPGANIMDSLAGLYQGVSTDIVAALDAVCREPSLIQGDLTKAQTLYRWAREFPGHNLASLLDDAALDDLVQRKHRLGLLG